MFRIITSFAITALFMTKIGCCAQLDDNLRDAMETLETRVRARESNGQNDNVIMVVGPTRGGKSTLVNLLAGQRIEARLATDGSGRTLLEGFLSPEIVIGYGASVGTIVPGSHYVEPRRTTIWDCPGFGDVRGPLADIINSASIFRVLNSVENVKVIIVIPQSAGLEDGGVTIPNLFNGVANLFEQRDQLKEMVSLVITKAQPNIRHILRGYLGDVTNSLNVQGRTLLQDLLSNGENRVAYIPMPSGVGPYVFDPEPLWGIIDGARFINRPSIRITHPAGSRDFLRTLSYHLNKSIAQELKENRRVFISSFKNSLSDANLDTIEQVILSKTNSLDSIKDVPHRRDDCKRVFDSIDMISSEARSSIISKIEQINTIKNICEDETVVDFEAEKWFGAVEETLEMFECMAQSTKNALNIKKLEEKKTKLEEEKNTLSANLGAERAEASELRNTVANRDSRIHDLGEEKNTLSANLGAERAVASELRNTVANRDSRIQVLDGEKNTLSTTLGDERAKTTALENHRKWMKDQALGALAKIQSIKDERHRYAHDGRLSRDDLHGQHHGFMGEVHAWVKTTRDDYVNKW